GRRHQPRCRDTAGSPAPPPSPPESPSRLLPGGPGTRQSAAPDARLRRRSPRPAGRTLSRLEIVQPAGLFHVTPGKDLSDLLGVFVLVVSHVEAVVGFVVGGLALSCVLRDMLL